MVKLKTRPTIRKFVPAISIFTLGLIVFLFAFHKQYPTRSYSPRVIETSIPTPTPEMVSVRLTADQTVTTWEIVDTSQSPILPTGIYFYGTNDGYSDVVKWNDYLIGFTIDYFVAKSSGGGLLDGGTISERNTIQTTVRHIRILNVITGEVYSISLQKPTWGEIDFIYPQLVEDVYFLKVGSYGPRNAGFQYRLQLPPHRNSVIQKLQFPIGNILFKYGNYYLTASCYEGCFYQKVNVDTLQTTELKRLNEAGNTYFDNRSENLIGFTSNGEMVLEITSSKEIITVSLLDEKTSRKFTGNKDNLVQRFSTQPTLTIQEQFQNLKLDSKYILVERTAKYPTSIVKKVDKNNLPDGAEIIE